MMEGSKQRQNANKKKAKDPPVIVAEKFRAAMQNENAESAMYSTLDLSACLSTPMQIIYSRSRIRKWIAFDRRVIRGCGADLEYDPETSITVDSESGRSVVSTYRIGALEFQDYFVLNGMLMVRSVKRTMRKLPPRSQEEKKLTELLLLTWTGPHFASYCTASSSAGHRIDNKIIALPVLDFSFSQLTDVRDMLVKAPRDGKEIRDTGIYLHFLNYIDTATRAQMAVAERQRQEEERMNMGNKSGKRDDVIIKAKNRVGDEGHIVIDRNELGRSNASSTLDNRIELLEDAEAVIRDDKSRYVASGMKLNNNQIEDAGEIELITRLVVMNAFYFLSWVDLASNKITSVPDLSPFPIVSLYLHDNRISSLEDVQNLKDMKLLQNLTLFGNPLQSDLPGKYKLPVLSLLLVPDEGAILKRAEEAKKKKQEAGTLKKAMNEIRASTPGGNVSISRAASTTPYSKAKTGTAAASAASGGGGGDNYEGGGGVDDEGEEDGISPQRGLHDVQSPTRLKYFPDLPKQKPPAPPPPILKLKTFDHSLVSPQDKTALSSWMEMYVKKPNTKKKRNLV